jgi:protein-tyrosine phosphatase
VAEIITPPPRYPKGSPVSHFFSLTDGDDIESTFLIDYAPFLQDSFQGGGIALSFHPVEYRIGSRTIFTSSAPCSDYVWHSSWAKKECLAHVAKEMKQKRITHIVVLLERSEIQEIYDGKLKSIYESFGFAVLSYPIPDHSIPQSIKSFGDFQAKLVELTEAHRVLVHCLGGLGRTGIVLAGLFIRLGNDAEKTIRMVRLKNPDAIETEEQEQFLRDYARR